MYVPTAVYRPTLCPRAQPFALQRCTAAAVCCTYSSAPKNTEPVSKSATNVYLELQLFSAAGLCRASNMSQPRYAIPGSTTVQRGVMYVKRKGPRVLSPPHRCFHKHAPKNPEKQNSNTRISMRVNVHSRRITRETSTHKEIRRTASRNQARQALCDQLAAPHAHSELLFSPRTSASRLMLTTIASPFINPLAAWLALYPLDSREARLATEGPTSCCCSRWSIVIRSIFARFPPGRCSFG